MNKIKLILTVALTFVVLFAQAGNAAAAPLAQDTTTDITGTVTGISFETDANDETIVVVTLLDDQNVTQTVRISVDTATSLGLLALDENGQPIVDPATGFPTPVDVTQLTEPITVTADTIIPDETEEETVHPISALLAAFFGEGDENLAGVIDDYHEDGFGFGVIAQALWMSQNLTGSEDETGDASLVEEILQAKQDKSFEEFFEAHPEIVLDGDVPTNWGQFRKVLLNKKQNLGVVVSGQADESTGLQQEHGNGNGNNNGNGNGNGNNGHGNGNNNGNGNGNSNRP
jgi:hypothetical protein